MPTTNFTELRQKSRHSTTRFFTWVKSYNRIKNVHDRKNHTLLMGRSRSNPNWSEIVKFPQWNLNRNTGRQEMLAKVLPKATRDRGSGRSYRLRIQCPQGKWTLLGSNPTTSYHRHPGLHDSKLTLIRFGHSKILRSNFFYAFVWNTTARNVLIMDILT